MVGEKVKIVYISYLVRYSLQQCNHSFIYFLFIVPSFLCRFYWTSFLNFLISSLFSIFLFFLSFTLIFSSLFALQIFTFFLVFSFFLFLPFLFSFLLQLYAQVTLKRTHRATIDNKQFSKRSLWISHVIVIRHICFKRNRCKSDMQIYL